MATTPQTLLDEARRAYHDLVLGKATAEFRDQNGETVKYNKTDQRSLLLYIQGLEQQIGSDAGTGRTLGPMRVFF